MKKRAEMTLWAVLELVGFFLIAYMLVNVASSIAQGTIYQKLNLAKDLTMQINAVLSVPGDVTIINRNLHGYSMHFFNDKVEVYENEFEHAKGVYYYVGIGQKIDVKFQKPSQLKISKLNNELKISNN